MKEILFKGAKIVYSAFIYESTRHILKCPVLSVVA